MTGRRHMKSGELFRLPSLSATLAINEANPESLFDSLPALLGTQRLLDR